MKETELLGRLMPSLPDLFPIIQNIREKYSIPEVNPEDDIEEILLTRDDIDWDAVHKDIEIQVQNLPLFEGSAANYIETVKRIQSTPIDFPELEVLPEASKEAIKELFSHEVQSLTSTLAFVDDKSYRPLTEIVYEYLLTGKNRDAPEEWFGKVFTMTGFGNKIVVAMAGEAADPKEIAEQFKGEFTKTFGKDRPKITEKHLSTAEYLAMKLQGKSIKYLVETYEERYPSEFPNDRSSKAYRQSVAKHIEMMKKRIQRLEDVIDKLAGDKK